MMPRWIVDPGLSLCCPRKDPSDGRCHDRFAEEQFPAVAAAIEISRESDGLHMDTTTTQSKLSFEFFLRLAESSSATPSPLRSHGGSKSAKISGI